MLYLCSNSFKIKTLTKIDSLSNLLSQILLQNANIKLIQSQRGIPARGTKPLKRFLWDEKHLETLTGGKYTHLPLRVNKLGGRDPETGHKVNQHIGGGVKFDYFMIDFHRRGPDEPNLSYDERVIEVRSDPNRTPFIALLAGAKGKRWILATENMKAGQIVKTFGYIPKNPVIGIEGYAYPLGALAAGTLINSIERFPTNNSEPFIINAGSSAQIVRQQGDFVIIRMPHKHEFSLDKRCMCTVGKLSNVELNEKQFGSANMHRRFGYKMSSGLWHKKDGYCGRKIYPLPPIRELGSEPSSETFVKEKFTLTKRQLNGSFGTAAVHPLVSSAQYRF